MKERDEMAKMIHGGDIYHNRVEYDFSVNTNALGIPKSVQTALAQAAVDCAKYPNPEVDALKAAIAKKDAVAEEWIVGGNGASELFAAIVHAIKPKKTLIPVPSFFGYEWAAGMEEGEICFFQMKEEDGFCLKEDFLPELTEEVDLLFLANPNNPVGNRIDEALLEEILVCCKKNHIYVVLDECFLEFCEQEAHSSYRSRIKDYPNLFLVRAFTKIFAIPGVRLGYLISANEVQREKIKRQLPEWNVSTFAQYAGVAAAKETAYIEKTVRFLKEERAYMLARIKEMREIYVNQSSETNFLLLKTKLPLYDSLLKNRILIRSCGNYRGLNENFYRIAIRTRSENEVLLKQIKAVCDIGFWDKSEG